MSENKQEVLFIHRCPVCKYHTKETYLMETSHLQIKNTDIVHFSFLKEKNGKKPFDRFKYYEMVILSCPQCGTFLSGDVCETTE